MEEAKGPYQTLLKYVKEYEQSVSGTKSVTFADQNMIRFYVKHTTKKDSRQELFLANGAGSRKGDEDLLNRALKKFHKVVTLVDIESGENLESLLQRGFHELFAQVLSDRYRDQINTAKRQREGYHGYLETEILDPVNLYVTDQLSDHIPGVQDVRFSPNLDTVAQTIANVDIQLDDTVETPLHLKGTGIRSAVIQMIMSFIADASRRAVVFAIEEPEAFLHPERHSSLAKELESFTSQPDISLIATTHSPFILTNNSNSDVFTVSKTSDGQTIIENSASRDKSIRRAKKLLTGSESMPTALDIIESVPSDSEAILIVEGATDKRYLQSAADRHDGKDLLDGICIVDSEGANDALKNTVVLYRIFENEMNVHTLLDNDGPGKRVHKVLTRRLKFQSNREVSKYSRWHSTDEHIEAEDLFPNSLIEAFSNEYTDEVIKGFSTLGDGTKHYDLSGTAKWDFATWVEENATEQDFKLWFDLLNGIRSELNLK